MVFFPGARWAALLLAVAAVATAITTLLDWTSLRPFLFVVLGELGFMMATHKSTGQIVHDVGTPANELRLIALLLERLERVETKLLTEFHKWASPLEMRARSHSAVLRAIEVEAVFDRVTKLEGTA